MKGKHLIPYFAIIMLLIINMSCGKNPGNITTNTIIDPITPQNTRPPVANAGPDKFIRLPANSVELDGSASNDSSGSELRFMWSIISGPSGSIIVQPSLKATSVRNLSEGIHSIELMVRNSSNVSSRDTVNITVSKPPYCQSNRHDQQIQLTLLGTIPADIRNPEIISAGNKLVVPQWFDHNLGKETDKVHIYDITNQNWTVTQVSKARSDVETIAVGNKIFFAGGLDYDETNYDVYVPVSAVDIYDITTNTWTVSNLSEARGAIKATVAGTKIFFAGGLKAGNMLSAKVDIYDLQTNTWSSANLNGGARAVAASVTSQNKSLFIGGYSEYANPTGFGYTITTPVGVIDVYDHITGQWSVLSMPSLKQQFSAIGKGENVYLSGGYLPTDYNFTFGVDILNLNTMTFSSSCLSNSMVFDDKQAAVKNDQILFYAAWGANRTGADIYNTQTGIWSIGNMPVNINPQSNPYVSMTFNNNDVYLVFGDKLYKMNF